MVNIDTKFSLYSYHDYRELLKHAQKNKRITGGQQFTTTKMAEYMRIQRTYLSAIFSLSGHLSSDQVFTVSEFLQFNTNEYSYIECLHEYNRSVNQNRKKQLKDKIENILARVNKTESHLQVTTPLQINSELTDFYLDFPSQLIHMFYSIEYFAKNPKRIAEALNLTHDSCIHKIEALKKIGLIDYDGKIKSDFHLSKDSKFFPTYRTNMRLNAMSLLNNSNDKDNYSFSALFSSDQHIRLELQQKFMEFLKWAQQFSQTQKPESVYQMNFDLLKWG